MNHTKSHYNNKDVLSEAPNKYFSKENQKKLLLETKILSTT
jgi:hypothetical protein